MALNPVNAETAKKPERKSKMFWVLGDYDVKHLKCWDCDSADGSLWWCPQAGFSGTTRHHFFTDEKTALEKLVSDLCSRKCHIETQLNKAVKRLDAL